MIKQKKSWWILVIVSIGVMVPFMYPYLTFDPDKSRVNITSTAIQYPVLVAHIIFAFIAIVTGFFQFIDSIRHRHPKIHRNIGRMYVISIFISGIFAFVLFFYTESFTKAMAFLVLTVLWLFTTWKAYQAAVKRRFHEHRKWIIRSFGITLAAVNARLLVPFLLLGYTVFHTFTLPGGRDLMIDEVLNINIWAGLVLNMVIVEWVIIPKSKNPLKSNK
ncbi:DUF2306 domain-containing protein [Neobacillus mesonae]|uniref:DUF2306 domain-containing protein n=1 Tax=Neobacillus mesonae TaxID=1193713 RepID=UPI00203EB149|nr:DUF2306 domain-containing protein [Neobacillus mesonae]MCM3569235.1 DUF2306 domain-containing protein [Neobacillus mesonae]